MKPGVVSLFLVWELRLGRTSSDISFLKRMFLALKNSSRGCCSSLQEVSQWFVAVECKRTGLCY